MRNFSFFKLMDMNKVILGVIAAFFIVFSANDTKAILPELYNTDKSKQQLEQINPYNGHLSFTIPVGMLGARGDLTFTPTLSIQTFWETSWFSYPDSTGGNNDVSYVFPPTSTYSYDTLFLGYLSQDYGGGSTQNCNAQHPNAGDVDYSRTHTRITFHAPDGSSIPLKDVMNNGAVLNRQPCSTYRPPRGTVFVGEGDSGITFISDNEIFDPRLSVNNPPPPDPPLSGTLYLKDGTKYKYNGATGRMTVIDKNGNLLTDADSVSGQGYTVTDSAGRKINYTSQFDPNDPSALVLEYNSVGINGHPMTVRVRHGYLHNRLRADYEQRAKYCATELFPTIGCLGYMGQDEIFDPIVISNIELPNGKAYKFYYNHYGELARVEYPEGSAVEYEHFQVRPLLPGNWNTRIVHRAVQEKRIYPNGGTGNTYETKTTFEYSYSDHTETTETATDKNDNFISKVKHYLYGEPYTDFSPNGRFGGAFFPYRYGLETKEYKTEYFSSLNTIIKTVETQWQQADGSSSTTAILNSPRVTQTKVTLNDTGQISHTDYGYDQYLNLTDVYEYDYGNEQPIRHNHTDYISDSGYTSITGGHLRSLPSATQVYGYQIGQQFLAAQSEIKYDETSLTPRTNIIGWTDPQRLTRGNATRTRSWLKYGNEPETWLETKAEYDVLGNVVKTIDAKNYASLIDYTDRFGTPDGEAQSNTPPAELNATSNHPQLFTFAFPTKITNASFNWATYSQFDYYTGKVVNTEDFNGLISKTVYDDLLDRPTQSVTAIGTSNEIQSKIFYDDDHQRIQTTTDLNTLNDNLIKSDSIYDGLGRTVETRRYESNGNYIAIKSIPFSMIQDPDTCVKRAANQVSNPYRANANQQPLPNEQIFWTTTLSDALGRTVKGITPDGAIIKTEYSGNAVTATDQAGKQRRSIINALGQLIRVDESTDATGLGTITSPNQPTYYTYDALNNLTQVLQGATSPTAQCNEAVPTCQKRTFAYDSLSRLKSATNPETGTTPTNGTISYIYDNNGNLTNKTDARGVQVTYDYDALNRIQTRTYSAPANLANYQASLPVTYIYDNVTNAKGKLTKVITGITTTPLSITDYQAFDAMGRVTQSQQKTDGMAYPAQTYTYNLSGALIEEKYPSGRVVKNVLDNNGDLSIVQSKKNQNAGYWNYADSFTYTAAGAVSSMQLGNGKWESTIFNSRLQPTQIVLGTTKGSTDKLNLNYEYGKLDATNGQTIPGTNNGNLSKQIIIVPTVGTVQGFTAVQSYQYDSLNRISQAAEQFTQNGQSQSVTTWWQVYNYDRYGNRTFNEQYTTTLPKSCGTYPNFTVCPADRKVVNPAISAGNNQIVQDQDGDSIADYLYDAVGNLTKDAQSRRFTYDSESKQTKVETLNQSNTVIATPGEYFYDGDGKRVKKIALDINNQLVTTVFVYDAGGKLVAEYTNQISSAPQVSYLTSDRLGSPRINTNQNGIVVARHDYQPFGEEIARTSYSADDIRKKFTGYERDNETDLDFAQARYYAKSIGRFNSPDMLLGSGKAQSTQTWNRYIYALNNPLILTDPTGLYECKVTATECQEFSDALSAAKEELKKYKEGSKEYNDLKAAISVYGCNAANPICGEKGKNGVTVWFGNSKKGFNSVTLVAGTVGKKTDANPNGQDIRVLFDREKFKDSRSVVASRVIHEGSHAAKGSAWIASGFDNKFNPTIYQVEKDAFTAESYFQEKAVSGTGTSYTFEDKKSSNGSVTYYVYNSSWKNVDDERLKNIEGIISRGYNVTSNAQGPNAFAKGTGFPKNWKPDF